MGKITAIIVAKDNPPFILKTINSAKDLVKKVIIIDIGIDPLLAKKLTNEKKKIEIIKIKEETPYVELIREKIKKLAQTEYVFFLDPDEEITPQLKKFIINNYENYDYISIPRKNIIFGKWINHSRWWPDYQIRVFKKDKVIWPDIIHSQPIASGKGFLIEPKEELSIIHYNYENINHYFQKFNRYALCEARYLLKKNQKLTLAETFKKSLNEFISRFFAEEGYKDGAHGFFLAILQMFYYFLVHLYYWEAKKYQNIDRENLITAAAQFFKLGTTETSYWLIDKKLINYTQRLKFKILNKVIKILRI